MFAVKADHSVVSSEKFDPTMTSQSNLLDRRLSDVLLMKSSVNRQLKYITPDSTVLDALNFMRDNGFTAAPIIDAAKRGQSRIIGVLNLFDLVIAISHSAELDNVGQGQSAINENLPIFQMPASALLGSSAESVHNWVFASSQSISEVLHTFASGVHRIVVVDDAGLVSKTESTDLNIENRSYILTQMDLLHYLMKNASSLPETACRSLFDLHLAPRNATFDHFHSYSTSPRKHIDDLDNAPAPAETHASHAAEAPPRSSSGVRRASVTDSLRFCLSTDSALHAFRQMHRDRRGDVTALCVVEQSTFKLIGTISSSDFKFLTSSNLSLLGLSVEDYLKRINSDMLDRSQSQRASYLFQVTNKGSDALFDAIKTMIENHVHRTWLCDDIGRPVAVVSCSDVFSKLSPLDSSLTREDSRDEL